MGTLLGIAVVGGAINSLVVGLVLMAWAKAVGKVESANFGRSYLTAYGGFLGLVLIYLMIGSAILKDPADFGRLFSQIGVAGAAVLFVLLSAATYSLSGKIFWKVPFMQAVRGTAIVPICTALLVLVGSGVS